MITLQNELFNHHPGSSIGVLVLQNVSNTSNHQKLNMLKNDLTNSLREKYGQISRKELKLIHPLDVYTSYYKKFGYTYHVLLQLESIVQGKSIPNVSALVEAMFMAELNNMLLTAGHDMEKIIAPLHLKVSTGKECYTGMNGNEMATISGDMMITDSAGIISSILKGPDSRTGISMTTRQALFTVYAPSGIHEDFVYQHLGDIEAYVHAFSNESTTHLKKVYRA